MNIRKLVGTTLMMTAAMAFCFTGIDANAATRTMLPGDGDNSGTYTIGDLRMMNSAISEFKRAARNGETYNNVDKYDMDNDNDLDYQDYALVKRLVCEEGYKFLGDMDGDHIFTSNDLYSFGNALSGYTYGKEIGNPALAYNAQADLDCDGDIDEDDQALLEIKLTELGDLNKDNKIDSTDLHIMADECGGYARYTSEGQRYYNYRADMDSDGDIDMDDYNLLKKDLGM